MQLAVSSGLSKKCSSVIATINVFTYFQVHVTRCADLDSELALSKKGSPEVVSQPTAVPSLAPLFHSSQRAVVHGIDQHVLRS